MKYIAILLLSASMFATYASAQVKVTFAYQTSDNFPYQIGDGVELPKDNPGIAVEMIQAVSKTLDIELTLMRLPWKRGLLTLEAGKIDGLFNASFKESRRQQGVYPTLNSSVDRSKRSYSNSYSLFTSKASDISWNGNHFSKRNFPLFVPRGFSIYDDLIKLGVTVVETNDIHNALSIVNDGKAEGIALLTPSGDAYLKSFPNKFKNVEKKSPPIKTKDYYLILSHQFVGKHPDIADAIWKSIEAFRESSSYNDLIIKYESLRD